MNTVTTVAYLLQSDEQQQVTSLHFNILTTSLIFIVALLM